MLIAVFYTPSLHILIPSVPSQIQEVRDLLGQHGDLRGHDEALGDFQEE